jgi:outer membrane protein OmpA-like peptidoglycan-associated protein
MGKYLAVSKTSAVGGLAAGLVLAFALSSCSWFRSSHEDNPKGEMRTAEGAPTPKFAKPQSTGQGAPDLASVPSDVPTPPSTKKEKEKIIEGLVADRERAHYTDQESRIQPVNVRPLTEAAAEAGEEPEAPPQAKGAPVAPVTKMQTAPGKAASADDLAKMAANTPPPPPAPDMAVGPVGPGGAVATGNAPGPRVAGGTVRSDGFRALESYSNTSSRNRVGYINFGFNSVSLNAADRRKVDDAAALGKEQGTFRVVSRSQDASQKAQQRATAVARELVGAGISQDRIFVGVDMGEEGVVEIMLDK